MATSVNTVNELRCTLECIIGQLGSQQRAGDVDWLAEGQTEGESRRPPRRTGRGGDVSTSLLNIWMIRCGKESDVFFLFFSEHQKKQSFVAKNVPIKVTGEIVLILEPLTQKNDPQPKLPPIPVSSLCSAVLIRQRVRGRGDSGGGGGVSLASS